MVGQERLAVQRPAVCAGPVATKLAFTCLQSDACGVAASVRTPILHPLRAQPGETGTSGTWCIQPLFTWLSLDEANCA